MEPQEHIVNFELLLGKLEQSSKPEDDMSTEKRERETVNERREVMTHTKFLFFYFFSLSLSLFT